MTRNTNNTNAIPDEHFASLDSELKAMHAALDRDAAARRREPDAQFEHRVAVGSFGGLMTNSANTVPAVAGRIGGGFLNARRLAAAIAIVATAGAAWLAMRPSGVSKTAEPIVAQHPIDENNPGNAQAITAVDVADDWIAVATSMDDGTGAEIDSLFADTVRVESNIRNVDSIFGGSISMDGGGT